MAKSPHLMEVKYRRYVPEEREKILFPLESPTSSNIPGGGIEPKGLDLEAKKMSFTFVY